MPPMMCLSCLCFGQVENATDPAVGGAATNAMSNEPQHAADDGSLARSTGGAAARGAMLIAAAVLIGVLLIVFALDDPATEVSAGDQIEQEDGGENAGDDSNSEEGDNSEDNTADPGEEETPPVDLIDPDPVTNDVRPPNEVNILVANGTGASGLAAGFSATLKAEGYTAGAANASTETVTDSVIYYKDGYAAEAQAVADLLSAVPSDGLLALAPAALPVAQDAIDDGRADQANVIVVIGTSGIPIG